MSILEKTGIFATGFLLIAVLASELVGLVANLIFAPLFGMRVTTISFFGLEFTISDNKWTKTFHKLSPIIQLQMLTRLQRIVVTLLSFHLVGIRASSHSTDFMPRAFFLMARATHFGAKA